MHEKYGSQGVVCMSVSTDEAEATPAVKAFLREKKATFGNYQLNVSQEEWQEKFNIKGAPAVFVFDKEGRLVQRFDTEDGRRFTYDDVEKRVKQLLNSGTQGTEQPASSR